MKGKAGEMSEISKVTRDLLNIIRFTEDLSAKIADVSDEDTLYSVLNAEFSRSSYSASIMLLTDDGSRLRYAMAVLPGTGMETMERITGISLGGFRLDLTRSELFRQIILEEKTVHIPADEIVEALVPHAFVPVLSKVPGIGKRMTVLTPLVQNGKVTGVFTMSSAELVEEFTPSVKILARHIASAMQRIEDITERRKLEAELQRHSGHLEELVEERTKRLRDAERLATIGQVAAAVGHDLRNPLQAMLSDLYLMKAELGRLPASQQEVAVEQGFVETIRKIERQVDYMNSIISELQDLARPVNPQLVRTDMRALLEDAVANTEVPANISITFGSANSRELPKPMVDAVMMKRVFSNLINNAVQAMPEGGHLVIDAVAGEEDLSVSFKDDGVGISKEDLGKLFQPLFTTKSKGQGLGLATCKRLVEAHGGRITVQSRLGRGATFTVVVPLGK